MSLTLARQVQRSTENERERIQVAQLVLSYTDGLPNVRVLDTNIVCQGICYARDFSERRGTLQAESHSCEMLWWKVGCCELIYRYVVTHENRLIAGSLFASLTPQHIAITRHREVAAWRNTLGNVLEWGFFAAWGGVVGSLILALIPG